MMTGKEYSKAIADLGMSQRGAARFLGIAERTSRLFVERGVSPGYQAIEILLLVMVARGLTPEEAYDLAGLKVPDSYEDTESAFGDQRLPHLRGLAT